MSAPNAASPVASAEAVARTRPAALAAGPVRRIAEGTFAMSLTEWRKLCHNQLDLLTRSVQPLLWLFVFGTAMSRLHSIPTGGIEYRAYLAPGIMAQAAMFIAIFFGIAVIWERDVGQLQRLLAIGTGAFACLSMTIASLVRERERFMGIGQLVMMPLFFASSALYPLAIMPGWLKVVAHVNPLTYEVEGLRSFLLGGGHPYLDILVCLGWLIVLATAATGAYPRALL